MARWAILAATLTACVLASGCMVTNSLRSAELRAPGDFSRYETPVKAHLVYVGGNSQHCDGNERQLLGMWETVADDVAEVLGVDKEQVRRHYYSWIGDSFHDVAAPCTPNIFRDRPWHGEEHIDSSLRRLGVFDDRRVPLILVGYSNGGATAFDLAARLCRVRGDAVSLLVTLDPVSRLAERNTFLGGSTWLNVYAQEHDMVIYTGGPWRSNAPESSLNRLVPGATHGDVRMFWNAVRDSEGFRNWGAATRQSIRRGRVIEPNCRYVGTRTARLQ